MTQFSLPIAESEATQFSRVKRGKTSLGVTKGRTRTNLNQHPNTPISLKGGINSKRREKVTFPLPKVCLQQLHALFSPSSFPTRI